jgi:hypothetical protein
MRELKVLYSILLLSVAGAVKLKLAFEFLGKTPTIEYLISAVAITYSAYAFDRGVKNEEDEDFSESFRKFLLVTSILSIFIGLALSMKPLLITPFIIGYLYSKGVKKFRLKSGGGIKNVVVALTWTLGIVLFIEEFSLKAFVIYTFFFLKSFINTVVYDFKDVDADRLAGIRTLPVCIETKKLKSLLLSINTFCHFLAMVAVSSHVLLMSFVNGTQYILRCKKNRRPNDVLVDGEWLVYEAVGFMLAYANVYSALIQPLPREVIVLVSCFY